MGKGLGYLVSMLVWDDLVASGYGPLCAKRSSAAALYSPHTACALCLLIPTRAGRDKCRMKIPTRPGRNKCRMKVSTRVGCDKCRIVNSDKSRSRQVLYESSDKSRLRQVSYC